MKKILFRADAYPSIGTGDLVSFIHFSRHLLRHGGWQPHFMIRGYPAALELQRAHGLERVVVIDPECSIDEETALLEQYFFHQEIDAVFFQITGRKLSEYDLGRLSVVKCAVDFYEWLPEGIDLVVNWDTRAAELYRNRHDTGTTFLTGPEYVFLQPELFERGTLPRPKHTPPRSILVAMGGADEFNLTWKVVEQLLPSLQTDNRLTVVIGAGYRQREELESLAGSHRGIIIRQNLPSLVDLYLETDYAFGAGGLTAYELVATGTPCSLISCYEHQTHRCEYFAARGWATFLGFRDSLLPITIPEAPSASSPCFTSRVDEVVADLDRLVEERRR